MSEKENELARATATSNPTAQSEVAAVWLQYGDERMQRACAEADGIVVFYHGIGASADTWSIGSFPAGLFANQEVMLRLLGGIQDYCKNKGWLDKIPKQPLVNKQAESNPPGTDVKRVSIPLPPGLMSNHPFMRPIRPE